MAIVYVYSFLAALWLSHFSLMRIPIVYVSSFWVVLWLFSLRPLVHCLCFFTLSRIFHLKYDQNECVKCLYISMQRSSWQIYGCSEIVVPILDLVSILGNWRCLYIRKILISMVYQVKTFYPFSRLLLLPLSLLYLD